MPKNFQTVSTYPEMPKKKQRSQALSFLDEESGDSSPRPPSPAPQVLRSQAISPVNSRVSVGSSAVTATTVEPRSGSASSGHSGGRLFAVAQERSHSSSPGTPPLSSTVVGCAAPPDLLQIVQLSGASLRQAALDLIDAYQQDAAPAILEVVRLAVAVSGSKFEVKLEDMERFEMDEIVEEASAVDQLPDQCPLLGKGLIGLLELWNYLQGTALLQGGCDPASASYLSRSHQQLMTIVQFHIRLCLWPVTLSSTTGSSWTSLPRSLSACLARRRGH